MDIHDFLKKCEIAPNKEYFCHKVQDYPYKCKIDFTITAYTGNDYREYSKLFHEMMEDSHTYDYQLDDIDFVLMDGRVKKLVEKDKKKSVTFVATMEFDVYGKEKENQLKRIYEIVNDKRLKRIFG